MRDGAPFNIPRNEISTLPPGCTAMLAFHFSRLSDEFVYKFHFRDSLGREWTVEVVPVGVPDSGGGK